MRNISGDNSLNKPKYLHWIIEEAGVLENNTIPIQCYRIEYNNDPEILDDWALHIRRHYISDEELKEDCELLRETPEMLLPPIIGQLK